MTYLYRHFDSQKRLLYIGISVRPLVRLDQHRLHSFWFDQIANVGIEKYASRNEALSAERSAIQLERPLFNIVHSPPQNEDYDDRCVRTWDIIKNIEPRLEAMFREACQATECANRVWYSRLKPRLCRLVGFMAQDPLLKSADVYDVAYQTIYAALPDCGPHCGGDQ